MKKFISALLVLSTVSAIFAVSASARVLGDVNGDGFANSSDALQILNYAVGNPSTINEKLADVDGNGFVNSSDALQVLTISVGSYNGPTNVDLKSELITPIFDSEKYTLSMTVIEKDDSGTATETNFTMMLNGKNLCVLTKLNLDGTVMDVRFLIVDGIVKLVIPDYRVTIIIPEEYMDGMDLGSIDFSELNFTEGQTYVKSRYVTEDGKKYTVERYKASDGSLSDYYYLDGKWTKYNTVNSSDAVLSTRKINEFKKGVVASNFSTAGTYEISLDKLIGMTGGMA